MTKLIFLLSKLIVKLKKLFTKIDRALIAREKLKNKKYYQQNLIYKKHKEKAPIRMRQFYNSCDNSNKYLIFRNNLYAFVTIIMVALALSTYKAFVLPKVYEKQIKQKISSCNQEHIMQVKYYNLQAIKGLYDDVFINHNYKIYGLVYDVNLYIKDNDKIAKSIAKLFKNNLDKTKNNNIKIANKNALSLLVQYELVTLSKNTGYLTASFINQNLKQKKQSMWIQVYFDNLQKEQLGKQIKCIIHYLELYSI
jgi:cell division protein ZapA (FtsZ GTPase activity inhibitor)